MTVYNPFKSSVALLVLFAMSSPSLAGGDDHPDAFDACREAKTERTLADCVTARRSEAENAVETRLETLLERHRESERPLATLIEEDQAHWRQYVETRCEVENYYSRGGTAYDVYMDACMATKYRERAVTLQRMIDNP